ncbi:Bidirectional sugar transporter sweet13, partial [Thalictrum thalictroides]
PTFYRVYKKKNTEGFQSIPYIVALFSAMLWLFYAYLKPNGSMLLTINTAGCIIESIYIIVYLIYAPRPAKIYTTRLLLLLNVVVFGLIVLFTILFAKEAKRATIVGWICSVFSVCVFAAPLSIMRQVIRTKSVEFMPISLSIFLTLCAIVWFFYGLLIMDLYVAGPNILGFLFGIAQMILYFIYKHARPNVAPEVDLPETQVKVTIQPSESNV